MMEATRILFVPGHWDMTSPVMMARLQKTKDLWQEADNRPYSRIITSGGITKPRQRISEAEFMKDWLATYAGIDSDKIIAECTSRDCYENVRNTVERYLRNPMYFSNNIEVTIVSQWEQAVRLGISFGAYRIRTRVAPAPGYSFQRRLLEWGYILYTFLDPKGESRFARWKAGRPAKTPERT